MTRREPYRQPCRRRVVKVLGERTRFWSSNRTLKLSCGHTTYSNAEVGAYSRCHQCTKERTERTGRPTRDDYDN